MEYAWLFVGKRGDTGEGAAAEEFERRAAAGGNVRDAIGHAALLDRGDRIAAADDRRAFDRRDGVRDGVGARGELVDLEDAHRPVPDDGPGVGQQGLVLLDGLGPDVQTHTLAD